MGKPFLFSREREPAEKYDLYAKLLKDRMKFSHLFFPKIQKAHVSTKLYLVSEQERFKIAQKGLDIYGYPLGIPQKTERKAFFFGHRSV